MSDPTLQDRLRNNHHDHADQICHEAADRIAELEAILEPLQNSVDKAESLGRKVQDWVAYAKQLEVDSGGAVGQENSRLRWRVKELEEKFRLRTELFAKYQSEKNALVAGLKERIDELEAHIWEIAEHHVTAIGEILGTHYHTDRRNFALKALEKP